MKLKRFFIKSISFFLLFLFILSFSCKTFTYNLEQFTGQKDSNFLNYLYPINSNDNKNPINETMNFCAIFVDEQGIFYSLIIELNKLNLNNTDFWFYEMYFYDYSPIQKAMQNQNDTNTSKGNEKNNLNQVIEPIRIKFSQTSINPMTQFNVSLNKISLGKNIFSWKDNKLIFEFKDKKNSIKVTANLYSENNFTITDSPIIRSPLGQSYFFVSADLPVECEYNFYYTDKLKIKKKLKGGTGIIYKSWGPNSISDYEFHFLKFSNFNLKNAEMNIPSEFLDKSFIILSIPKSRFYSVVEISRENNIPVYNIIKNFIPENDYSYSKIIADKNRRYPSFFSIFLKNNLFKFWPIYEKSVVQFFTHDSWFGMVGIYDSAGRIIGLGFSNLFEYSRMK
ncbi:MAG: hypothetical protein ACK4YF_00020 [Exilispira sp.]